MVAPSPRSIGGFIYPNPAEIPWRAISCENGYMVGRRFGSFSFQGQRCLGASVSINKDAQSIPTEAVEIRRVVSKK